MKKIDSKDHHQTDKMEKAIKTTDDGRIENSIAEKVQPAFAKDAGSYRLNTIATVATIEVMKDDK